MTDGNIPWNNTIGTDSYLNHTTHLSGSTAERNASTNWPLYMPYYDTDEKKWYRNTGTLAVPVATEIGISEIAADTQFAPTTKSTDGSTAIAVADSEFTTPTTTTVSSSDSVNSNGVTTTTIVDNAATVALSTFSSVADSRGGTFITDTGLRSQHFGTVTMNLKKVGAPTGTAVATIRKTSDDTVVGTSGTVDVSTISTAYVDVVFTFSPAVLSPNEDFRIQVEYSGGDGANYLEYRWTNGSSTYAGGYATRYNGAYTNYTASDIRMEFTTLNYASALKDDKANPTTRKWQSNSEIGPWFKGDMNTAQELLGIAIHFHANTNVTSFKIETSADDVTYIRRKTIPYTLITAGAWNIILIPRSPLLVRYIKITGLDAGAKIFSVNEMATFILTSDIINRRHRHVVYTPTTSASTLTGA